MIEVRNLAFTYRQQPVLRDVSFVVSPMFMLLYVSVWKVSIEVELMDMVNGWNMAVSLS